MRVRSVAASDIAFAILLPRMPHIRVSQEAIHRRVERVCQAFDGNWGQFLIFVGFPQCGLANRGVAYKSSDSLPI